MSYYYFIDGFDRVFVREEYICDGDLLHKQYRELSQQETDYFLAHPDATAHEVKQLCSDEELARSALPGLPAYRLELFSQLSELARRQSERLVPQERLSDALHDLLAGTGERIMAGESDARACNDLLGYYARIRRAIKKEMFRVMLLINQAATHQQADEAFARHRINEIKTGEEDYGQEEPQRD